MLRISGAHILILPLNFKNKFQKIKSIATKNHRLIELIFVDKSDIFPLQ